MINLARNFEKPSTSNLYDTLVVAQPLSKGMLDKTYGPAEDSNPTSR